MLTLPYVMIGVGCGIFGGNLGTQSKFICCARQPCGKAGGDRGKDERNIAVRNMAKAKA